MQLAAAAAAKSPSAWAEPGTLGFLVVFGMAIILFFVFRSMSKHLRKVREAALREQDQSGPGEDSDGGSPPGGLRPDSGDQRPGGSAPGTPEDSEHDRTQSEQNPALLDFRA
jgi:hypothetical protein